MIVSPDSRKGRRSLMVLSTAAAGTISQILLGLSRRFAKSSKEAAPMAPSLARPSTAFGNKSNTTQRCPPLMSRRTMFAPIRPRPTIPSCIVVCSFITCSPLVELHCGSILHRRSFEDALDCFVDHGVKFGIGLPRGEPFGPRARKACDYAAVATQPTISFFPRITARKREHPDHLRMSDEF